MVRCGLRVRISFGLRISDFLRFSGFGASDFGTGLADFRAPPQRPPAITRSIEREFDHYFRSCMPRALPHVHPQSGSELPAASERLTGHAPQLRPHVSRFTSGVSRSDFGFRVSDLRPGLPSVFGFRISVPAGLRPFAAGRFSLALTDRPPTVLPEGTPYRE